MFETFPLSMSDSISQYFLDAVSQRITNPTNFTFISPILGYKKDIVKDLSKIKKKSRSVLHISFYKFLTLLRIRHLHHESQLWHMDQFSPHKI